MDDIHFDILDELYFVTKFEDILAQSGLAEQVLKQGLMEMLKIGYVKILKSPDEEVAFSESYYEQNYATHMYLATKAGLKAHNGL